MFYNLPHVIFDGISVISTFWLLFVRLFSNTRHHRNVNCIDFTVLWPFVVLSPSKTRKVMEKMPLKKKETRAKMAHKYHKQHNMVRKRPLVSVRVTWHKYRMRKKKRIQLDVQCAVCRAVLFIRFDGFFLHFFSLCRFSSSGGIVYTKNPIYNTTHRNNIIYGPP